MLQKRGSLSFFNIKEIVAWRSVGWRMSDFSDSLIMFSRSGDSLSANVFKNLSGKPSGLGYFLFCMDRKALLSSPTVKGSSRAEDVSGSMEGMFKDSKKFSNRDEL